MWRKLLTLLAIVTGLTAHTNEGRLYEVDELPTVVLIDRAGIVREVLHGERRGAGRTPEERIRTLLREL